MNALQLEASDADVSSTSLANVARGLEKNITMRDLVATFLYPNTLFVIEVTGAQLKEAMERSASYFRLIDGQVDVSPIFVNPKAEHYNYDVFGGVEYTIDLRRPTGQRITSLTRQGIPVSLDESLRLVTSNYRAIGGGDYTMFYKAPILKELPIGPLELLRDYCLKMKRITPPPPPYQILR
jgi:2',3'-cyclic-nucleotide 2'-phosphodiesterase/3'-nucleotidase